MSLTKEQEMGTSALENMIQLNKAYQEEGK